MRSLSFPPIQSHQVRAMDELLAGFRRDGARVVMVQAPEYLAPTGHDEDTRLYDDLARKHRVPFLNYNKALRSALNDDATLYNDWQHLNERGAERFSRRLRHELVKQGLISPR